MLSTRGNPLLFILFSIFHYYVLQLQLIPWLWVSKNRTKTFNKRRFCNNKGSARRATNLPSSTLTHKGSARSGEAATINFTLSYFFVGLCSLSYPSHKEKPIPDQHTGERQHVKVVLRTNGLRAVSCATILRARWYRVTVLQDGLWTVFASFLGKEELPGLLMSSNLVCLWFHTAHTRTQRPLAR